MFGSPASLAFVPYAYDFQSYGNERLLHYVVLMPILNLWRRVAVHRR